MSKRFVLYEGELKLGHSVLWVVIHLMCIYELVALHTKGLPTISRLAWTYRHGLLGKVMIASFLGILGYHLFFQQEEIKKMVAEVLDGLAAEVDS